MIKAIIVDDEKHCCESLQWQLKKYCPEIQVIGICNDAKTAMNMILLPDIRLMFLDVEMPGMNGFEMLEALPSISFDIIFTTAYDHYAIRAIRFGALDYLLKPVDKDELRLSVYRFLHRNKEDSLKQITALLTHIRKSNDLSFRKIAFPTMNGFELVPLENIVVCESFSNYTHVRLSSGQVLIVSRTLKDIEEILDMLPFFRIHHSYLVNLQFAIRYLKGEGGMLVLNNDLTIPVSKSKKEELLKIIAHLSYR